MAEQVAIEVRVHLLAKRGPDLGQPTVDTIRSSRHHNMKELRVGAGAVIRILFVFDPRREAILPVGGDKSGSWSNWYRVNIPIADDLYDDYLADLHDQGLI